MSELLPMPAYRVAQDIKGLSQVLGFLEALRSGVLGATVAGLGTAIENVRYARDHLIEHGIREIELEPASPESGGS